jgi:hypothetical protein
MLQHFLHPNPKQKNSFIVQNSELTEIWHWYHTRIQQMMTRFYSPAKHLLIGLALVACGSTASMAQGVVNNGAKINITASTFLVIDNGGFDNRVNGAVTNAGTMDLDGDWLNADPNGVFGLTPSTGTVRLDGNNSAVIQNIGGTKETHFYNLVVKDNSRKMLTGLEGIVKRGATVHNTLTLSNQSLALNTRTLTMENDLDDIDPNSAFSASGGYVISETGPASGGYGIVKWNIPSTGSYTVPFGTGPAVPTVPVDVSFVYNVTQAGTPISPSGNYKTFATYPTDAYNSFDEVTYNNIATGPFIPYPNPGTPWSDLPHSVEHLTDDYIQAAHRWVADRFWIIDEGNIGAGPDHEGTDDGGGADNAPGYSSINPKPQVDYTFKYRNTEVAGPINHITAGNLRPQRYNHELDKWGDWFYEVPNIVNTTGGSAGTVLMHIGQDDPGGNPLSWLEDMYPVWTLVDNSDPLPIELVRFAGECGDGSIELKWTTWTETNNDFFTVERSNNGTDFEIVDVIEGAGNSNQSITYNAVDNLPYGGTSYYRLKNTDFTGKFEYSEIIAVTCGTDGNDFNFVNAYDVDQTDIIVEFTAADNEDYTIFLYDAAGRRALDFAGVGVDGMNKVRLPAGNLARGIYIINLSNSKKNFSKRVMLH